MRSDTTQLDVFRDDPAHVAKAWRAAADIAQHDIHFTEAERQRRADYYRTEAERLEANAR